MQRLPRPRASPLQRPSLPSTGSSNSSSSSEQSAVQHHQSAAFGRPHQPQPSLMQVMQELRAIAGKITRLQDGQVQLAQKVDALIKSQEDHVKKSFVIDKTNYQDQLNLEVTRVFCRNIRREPSREELKTIISKALKDEAKVKFKYEKAKGYVLHKFVEMRSEERRRLFAMKPCEHFGRLTSEEFAERFCATMKAPDEDIQLYMRIVVAMRKFKQMVGADARVNTHQKFRKWLDSTFSDGTPTEDDWKSLLEEDHQICYGIAECEEEGILEEGLAQDDWQLQQAQLQSEEEQR